MTVTLTVSDPSRAGPAAHLSYPDVPYPDVYFTPGYGAAAASAEGGRWQLAHWDDRILLPYLLRPVDSEWSDATSPIGFCGIHVDPRCSSTEVARFWSLTVDHLRDAGVVSVFLRFSPLDPDSVRAVRTLDGLRVSQHHDTITVDTGPGPQQVWHGMVGRSRTAVRKATSAGLAGTIRPARIDDLVVGSRFRCLYEATMRRVGCRPVYHYKDDYYRLLLESLGENLVLTEVRGPDGNVVAAALFMRYAGRVHYHLAGSDDHSARAGANNLMIWTALRWAAEAGCSRFHLGGGLGPDDALFMFKRSFGGRRTPFHTGTAVLAPQQYRELTSARARDLGRDPADLDNVAFFPAYRFGQ